MRWMIASDIHGSAFYCRMLFEQYKKESADRMILLGDLLYHGPRNDLPKDYNPRAVIEMLNAHASDILCVRGNCEAEVDQMVLSFPVMGEYALLPYKEKLIYITHGHHASASNPPALKKGDILLHGHTHVPACIEYSNFIYMNPGSIAIPKEGSCHSYMVFEEGEFQWKNLETGEVYKDYRITACGS